MVNLELISNLNLITTMNLMRQIDNEVKPQWEQIKNGRKLDGYEGDCPPSLLKGWTDDNPSLWEIDNPLKPNKEKILFALCRRQKEWDKIAFLLFDIGAIENSNLSITQTNGNTGDNKIDTSNTHYEIKNLRAKSLCTLIYHIMVSNFEIGYFKKSEFDKILFNAYDNSQVIAQPKTDTMSIQPSSIGAIADTINKESLNPVNHIDKLEKSNTSLSIDISPLKSTSTSL